MQANGNVPWTDQRSHTTLVDERYIEMLSRLPPGLQDPFGAVFLAIEQSLEEAQRLESLMPDPETGAYKVPPNERGDIRILKGTTTYAATDGTMRSVPIYSVIPAIQLPYYVNKARVQAAQMKSWAFRMYRLLIGEDGKGRQEMIDAMNATSGRLLPPEARGGIVMAMPPNPMQPQPQKRSIFSGGLKNK